MDRNSLFGGNPLAVIVRLIVLSIIVGIVMSALHIRPEDLFYHISRLIDRLSYLGVDVFRGAFGYFLLGAAVVIPIWLIARILGAVSGNRQRRE
ncbi:MAG: integrase [Proteobacteria bacterium]|nr:integrase [Pseudomonadota bacterium]